MRSDQVFRWAVMAVFFGMFLISGYFRRRARQSGEVVSRRSEGMPILFARLIFASPLYLSFLAYVLDPAWMEWSSFDVPVWLRWLAVIVGVGTLPLLYWVMISIGKNISETTLTKESHELVVHGPYRWVRHPLYSVAALGLVSLSIVAANWFMMGMALIALAAISLFVVPREEAELILKFGDEYLEYRARTGRFAPRLFGRDRASSPH